MTDRTATLNYSDGSQAFDVPGAIRHDRTGRDRHPRALRQDRQVHLRPGLHVDGGVQSKITYIDGDKGVLLYRGYPIEQLAVHCDFLEVCHLLLNGELPTPAAEGQVRLDRDAPHDGARADAALPAAASAATRIRWR